MKKILLITCFFISINNVYAKKSKKYLKKTAFQKMLLKEVDLSIPIISVHKLQQFMKKKKKIVLLDAREKNEFQISHIKKAISVGYKKFSLNKMNKMNKKSLIIVYCSVGVRSSKIAKKLIKNGYKRVYNLYGGIFKWVNNGNPVYNIKQKKTKKIHAFDKNWGKWIKIGIKKY